MRYRPQQSHPAELHGYKGNAARSSFCDNEPPSPPWTPPDSDDEMDFPPPEDNVFDEQILLQMSPAHDKRRMIECMDSLARRDIIEINNSDKKQEDERRKKNVDQMMYPNLTTHTASKRNNDEEFERMEAYCNFSKSVDTNDRSRYKNIEHSYEGNGYDRKRAAAQSLPQSPQISLTQGQQKRNAFPHPQRILVPYPQPPIRSKSNLSSDIHSEPESDLENNLDIDSPDETDSDNDISYVGHYADSSASRYSGNAMDREGMSEIGRDLSYISSREMQRLDKDDLRTDRDNCYSSNDDYVEANNLIYSSYGDDISIGINTWDSKPKEGCHQESTQYTMVENPLHRDNTNRDIAGERERNRHLFGRRRGAVEGHVSTSGTGLHTQNEDSGEVQDDSKDSTCSLIPLAQTAAVAVEKSNIRDREEELYKLMGISYGSTPQSPPLSSSLSHRSSPLRRSLSNTNQISSPYRNPLCPRRGTDFYRGADLMRSNNLEINATQSTLMHMQSSISQKEAAGALESSWESKLKSNEQRAGTGTKQYHSLPRIKLLCGWLSSLNIWDRDIEPSTLHTELRSGLFLIRLVQTLDPSAVFLSVNVKVHSARPALENLENVLGHVMRTKKVNKNKIPTARQLYDGNQPKLVSFVFELFHTYVEKDWGGWRGVRTTDMLLWFCDILCQYSRPINSRHSYEDSRPINSRQSHEGKRGLKAKVSESSHEHFRTGTDIFCILYHFYGPCVVSDGINIISIDPSRVFFSPRSLPDMRSNVSYVFDILETLGLDVFWTVDEWINLDETCFMVLQLSKLYDLCRDRQCVLPLADTLKLTPGITSGPFGRPLIVGLCFADTPAPPSPFNYEV